MKKITLMSTAFVMLAFLLIGTSACSKEAKKPADLIVGDYIGSGTDANENPFLFQTVRITRVSNKRVKIEPVGHSHIAAFEINVEWFKDANKVASTGNEYESIAAEIGEESVTLGLTGTQDESFAGTKQ